MYTKLPQKDEDYTSDPAKSSHFQQCVAAHLWHRFGLTLSLFGNLMLILYILTSTPTIVVNKSASPHSGLERNILTHFDHHSPYNSPNRSVADHAWDDVFRVDPGLVMFDESYVKEKGIPPSQPWPWDGRKQNYLLSAHHNLHCLKLIRRKMIHLVNGEPIGPDHREGSTEHMLHCIETLRQDQICNADDTLHYIDTNNKAAGSVQAPRMCRDFSKLEAWAKERTSCWKDLWRDGYKGPEIDKYKFCPEGYVFEKTGSTKPPWEL